MGDVDTAPDATSRAREADAPRNSLVARFGADRPLKLDAGVELSPFQIAYKTYGTLNAERSNAMLICHALTGDHHVASPNPVTGKSGWWEPWSGPASRSTPSAISSSARTCSAAAWAPPGRPRPIPRPASRGAWNFPSSPSATWFARRPCCSTSSASTAVLRWPAARWAACRCCNGRRAFPSACSARCRSPARRGTRRRTSPSTRSAARR